MTNIDKIALLRICKSIFLARTVESDRWYQKITTGYTYDDFTLCSPNVFIASFDSLIKERKYAIARFAISGMRFQFKPICDIKFITREWDSEITFEWGRKLFFLIKKISFHNLSVLWFIPTITGQCSINMSTSDFDAANAVESPPLIHREKVIKVKYLIIEA